MAVARSLCAGLWRASALATEISVMRTCASASPRRCVRMGCIAAPWLTGVEASSNAVSARLHLEPVRSTNVFVSPPVLTLVTLDSIVVSKTTDAEARSSVASVMARALKTSAPQSQLHRRRQRSCPLWHRWRRHRRLPRRLGRRLAPLAYPSPATRRCSVGRSLMDAEELFSVELQKESAPDQLTSVGRICVFVCPLMGCATRSVARLTMAVAKSSRVSRGTPLLPGSSRP
mmetsp:Transcript_51503/g.112918  ORF Transcript_51503/g.112918 Transcript_51503/m.112918 type:complete len:231 (+) Transcript_51503:144-836(+)